jgi:uncharacterized membrane protein YkoI
MKRILILAVLAVFLLAGCKGKEPAQDQAAKQTGGIQTGQVFPTDTNPATGITAEKARQIALEHAGLTEDQLSEFSLEEDLYARVPHYDVEFACGNDRYAYEIDAHTGEIMSCFGPGDQKPEEQPSTEQEISVTEEMAKVIALDRAQVTEEQISDLQIELNLDDAAYYDVTFLVDKEEYAYQIDAVTGEILSAIEPDETTEQETEESEQETETTEEKSETTEQATETTKPETTNS